MGTEKKIAQSFIVIEDAIAAIKITLFSKFIAIIMAFIIIKAVSKKEEVQYQN